jgi:dipeptidyl aminopeptidase/acylaminoacyl peptidase
MRISFSKKLISCKNFILDEKIFDSVPEEKRERARAVAKGIEAVDFEYLVNGKKYNGFYARLKSLERDRKHPVVVLNRGGSGLFGHIDAKHIFSGLATPAIKAGYVVIGSQCMGFAEDGARDEMGGEDFQSVVNLKELIDADDMADPERIGIYCASRGAVATFRLLSETNWVKAAVVISGALDFFDDDFRPEMKEHYKKMFGGSPEEREKRSALSWPEKLPKDVPILLMYGTSDWRVDPRSALRFSEKLIDLKVPHRLVMFEGNDHFLLESRQESRAMAMAWLDRFVRNGEPLPDMEPHGK